MWNRALGLALPVAVAIVAVARAQPNFGAERHLGSLTVFPDVRDSGLYYYVPGPIKMAENDGVPLFDFIQTRYTGSALRGDQGSFRIFSQVTVSVETVPTDPQLLEAAAASLGRAGGVELRPVPLSRLEGDLVYALPGSDSLVHTGSDSVSIESKEGRWFDRTLTVRLNDAASMVLWNALQENQAILSFAYAYVAVGVERPAEYVQTSGTIGGTDTLRAEEAPPSVEERVVLADAFEIDLDPARYPEHFTRVDLNGDRAPPGYAALAVRCYDFRDNLREDLWEKLLEIEAESVSGRPSRISISFSIDDVRIYKKSARFPYAVRLDKPYRFRVTETDMDGSETVGPWIEQISWVEPLDITTPYERLMELRDTHDAEDSQDK